MLEKGIRAATTRLERGGKRQSERKRERMHEREREKNAVETNLTTHVI